MGSSRDLGSDLMNAVFSRAQARQDAIKHGKRSERAKRAVNGDARAIDAQTLFNLNGCRSTAHSYSFARAAAAGLGTSSKSFARDAYASARIAACLTRQCHVLLGCQDSGLRAALRTPEECTSYPYAALLPARACQGQLLIYLRLSPSRSRVLQ